MYRSFDTVLKDKVLHDILSEEVHNKLILRDSVRGAKSWIDFGKRFHRVCRSLLGNEPVQYKGIQIPSSIIFALNRLCILFVDEYEDLFMYILDDNAIFPINKENEFILSTPITGSRRYRISLENIGRGLSSQFSGIGGGLSEYHIVAANCGFGIGAREPDYIPLFLTTPPVVHIRRSDVRDAKYFPDKEEMLDILIDVKDEIVSNISSGPLTRTLVFRTTDAFMHFIGRWKETIDSVKI